MFLSVSLLSQAPLARGSRALPSVLFLIGLVVISAASIVWLCTRRMKKRRGMLPSSYGVDCQPSHIYEDVDIVNLQDMQLQENVAYGQVKGF